MSSSNQESDVKTVISGSFRKHLSQIYDLRSKLEKKGIHVLSPRGQGSVNPEEEFVVLDSDLIYNPEILQSSVFAKIRISTFLVIANFDGYIGNAAILEIGYAVAVGIKVYSLQPVADPNLAPYIHRLQSVFPDLVLDTLEKCYIS